MRVLNEDCLSYSPMPVGFANADFVGNFRNPYLDGIKTPKYLQSAPKPVSADVMAVNMASRMTGGNRQTNARMILDQYQKEAKVWVPPTFSIRPATSFDLVNQAATIQQRKLNTSRGVQMTQQTISTQSEPTVNMDNIIVRYYDLKVKDAQTRAGKALYSNLSKQGIDLNSFNVNWTRLGAGSVVERAQEIRRMVEAGMAMNATVDYSSFFSPLTAVVRAGKAPETSQAGTSQAGTSQAGASTVMSDALTQQGTALPSTTPTSSETQKK